MIGAKMTEVRKQDLEKKLSLGNRVYESYGKILCSRPSGKKSQSLVPQRPPKPQGVETTISSGALVG